MVLFIVKIVIALFFLIMFLRRSNVAWGAGLLTVTTAVMLDALGIFIGRDALVDQLGFFSNVIGGALLGGAAVWIIGLLNPNRAQINIEPTVSPSKLRVSGDMVVLLEQMRHRFSNEDVLDLLFDLGISENDVIVPNMPTTQTITNVVEYAQKNGKAEQMGYAVERILSPVSANQLPRPEALTADMPPNILRQSLTTYYNPRQLQGLAQALRIDWDSLGAVEKSGKVRNLLLMLVRRDRLNDLVTVISGRPQPTVIR